MSTEDELAGELTAPDPAAVPHAISWCLHSLACGWSLHPAERQAALTLLKTCIPGVDAATLAAAQKILAAPRRLTTRQRDWAAELSVRLAEQAITRQSCAG